MPKKRPISPPDELRAFPARMRYARDMAGLTLTALSEKTGIFTSHLSRIESGERSNGVEAATAIRIAKGLGQQVGWLLAGQGQPNQIPVIRQTDRRKLDFGRKLRDDSKSAPAVAPVPRNVHRR